MNTFYALSVEFTTDFSLSSFICIKHERQKKSKELRTQKENLDVIYSVPPLSCL